MENVEDYIKTLIGDLQEWGQDQQSRMFSGILKDRDNLLISNGRVILEDDAALGVFWPNSEWPRDKRPDSAEFLESSDSRRFQIQKLRRAVSDLKMNYLVFDVVKQLPPLPTEPGDQWG